MSQKVGGPTGERNFLPRGYHTVVTTAWKVLSWHAKTRATLMPTWDELKGASSHRWGKATDKSKKTTNQKTSLKQVFWLNGSFKNSL